MRVICAVLDSAVQAFGTPFFVQADGHALRSFIDEVNRQAPDNTLFGHPEDYTLYHLGEFNEEDGAFISDKRVLARGKDVKREAP